MELKSVSWISEFLSLELRVSLCVCVCVCDCWTHLKVHFAGTSPENTGQIRIGYQGHRVKVKVTCLCILFAGVNWTVVLYFLQNFTRSFATFINVYFENTMKCLPLKNVGARFVVVVVSGWNAKPGIPGHPF